MNNLYLSKVHYLYEDEYFVPYYGRENLGVYFDKKIAKKISKVYSKKIEDFFIEEEDEEGNDLESINFSVTHFEIDNIINNEVFILNISADVHCEEMIDGYIMFNKEHEYIFSTLEEAKSFIEKSIETEKENMRLFVPKNTTHINYEEIMENLNNDTLDLGISYSLEKIDINNSKITPIMSDYLQMPYSEDIVKSEEELEEYNVPNKNYYNNEEDYNNYQLSFCNSVFTFEEKKDILKEII